MVRGKASNELANVKFRVFASAREKHPKAGILRAAYIHSIKSRTTDRSALSNCAPWVPLGPGNWLMLLGPSPGRDSTPPFLR